MRSPWLLVLCCLLQPLALRAATTPTEQQVKAVFVFNFTHFTEWPAESFASRDQALGICVLGNDEFAGQLDEVVRGERVGDHPLEVRRLRTAQGTDDCHILYIDRSEASRFGQVLGGLAHSHTLTVSDLDGAARQGAMVEFAKNENRIRLMINVDSARAAGLTLSSKLLRPAEIVQTSGRG